MQDSGIIISVNNDPDAPINKIADYVINGNVEDVVPKLIKYLRSALDNSYTLPLNSCAISAITV